MSDEYTPADAIADQVEENSRESGGERHVPDPAPLPESQSVPDPVLEFPDTVPQPTVQKESQAAPKSPESQPTDQPEKSSPEAPTGASVDLTPLLTELQSMTAEVRGLRTDLSHIQTTPAAQAPQGVSQTLQPPREPVRRKLYKSSRQRASKKYKTEMQQYQAELNAYHASQMPAKPVEENQGQAFGNVQDKVADQKRPTPARPAASTPDVVQEPEVQSSPDTNSRGVDSARNMQQQLQKTLASSQQSLTQIVSICQSLLQTLEQHSQQMEAMQERISSLSQMALQSTRGRSQRNAWK